MSAKPRRDHPSLIDPSGDDTDRLRSMVSAMLSGNYPEDVWLRDVSGQSQANPEFGRNLLALIERYRRLGQMPAAQYGRIRQKLEASLPAKAAAAPARTAAAVKEQSPGGSSPRKSPRLPALPAEATTTAPLAGESAPGRPASAKPQAAAPTRKPAAPADAATKPTSTPTPPSPTPRLAAAATNSHRATAAAPAAPSAPPASPAPAISPAAQLAPLARPDPPSKVPRVIGPGTVLRERYELGGLLGCGGMATVYKAVDRYRASLGLPDCQVALKIIAPDAATPADDAALGREFHNAQQLSHPNIVNVFEIDHEAGATFYTMELLEGEQLDELLGRIGGPLPLPQALTVIRDIGAAIEHAHARGILHADLKPQNVFVTFGGQVRILDFGGLTMPASAPGPGGPWVGELPLIAANEHYRIATPAYASCEQLEGQQVDPRDDIYAIACIGYELITGRHPFDGLTALQARAQHLHPRRPTQLSGGSWRALRRALSFRRAQRPSDIAPWLEQLGIAEAALRLPPSYELRAQPARSSWGQWLTLAACLTLCAGAALALMQQKPGPPNWNGLVTSARSSLQQARAAVQARLAGAQRPIDRANTTPTDASASLAAPQEHHRPPTLLASATAPPVQDHTSEAAPPSAAPGASISGAAGARPDNPAASDSQGLKFSSTTYEVDDTSPAARVVVRRSGGTQDDLRFVWWTLDDTAKADVDYAPLGRRIEHFLPGQDQMTLYVPIISNPLRHETNTFYVALGPPGVAEGSPSARASVTIDRGG